MSVPGCFLLRAADHPDSGEVVVIAPGPVFVVPGSAARTAPLLRSAQRLKIEHRRASLDSADSPCIHPVATLIHRRAALQREDILPVELSAIDEHTGVAARRIGFQSASEA